MPPPVDPVTSPVTFPFENGAIKLVTVIDPVSGCHTVVCDLCDKSIPLGIWVFKNRLQQTGESRAIFLTVRFIYKALKLTKGTDLTQYPQPILTSMMEKDTN